MSFLWTVLHYGLYPVRHPPHHHQAQAVRSARFARGPENVGTESFVDLTDKDACFCQMVDRSAHADFSFFFRDRGHAGRFGGAP